MLNEYRKITFPKEDLIKAIMAHDKSTTGNLRSGEITSLQFGSSPEPEIVVNFHDRGLGETHSLTLDSSYVIAAMVRYCIDNRVPMPAQAEKGIERAGEDLALSIMISEQTRKAADTRYYVLL